MQKGLLLLLFPLFTSSCLLPVLAAQAESLAPGVRGVATRAPKTVTIDGNLEEFAKAFCTPINYFHPDSKNRPAQFFYMWDDSAFYAGLRTLDEHPHNGAPDNRLWEGDGVEWYFDTRRGDDFRSTSWTNNGSVHCYWVGLKGDKVEPRFCLRPGYLDAIPKTGVEVAARRTASGMEVEFKLPWKNFPQFTPKSGEVIGLDAELCYSDGGPRVDRFFAYGSPLSVQQPASLARVQLVDKLTHEHWSACGPVMMPIRIDVAWAQERKAEAYGRISLPPNHLDQVGKVEFQLLDMKGNSLGTYPVTQQRSLAGADGFQMAEARWPIDAAAPGQHHVMAVVYDQQGNELARIAPRLVSTAMKQGY